MPITGQTKSHGYKKFVWAACIGCGKERWVCLVRNKPRALRCRSCAVNNRPLDAFHRWTGGRHINNGYPRVWVQSNDFFYPMVSTNRCKSGGYVLEHRLVMAKHLLRNLQGWEIVHHKNHVKDDNRIKNLQLVTDDRHKQITVLERKVLYLENKVSELTLSLKNSLSK